MSIFVRLVSRYSVASALPGSLENPNVRGLRKKQPSLELQNEWSQLLGDVVASGTNCVAPSMNPSTFNDTHHVIVDDEYLGTADDVTTKDDDIFVSSQHPPDSSHLEHLENEDGVFYSNLMNFASERESAGAAMFKNFITQQSVTQKRALELLESDASPVNQSRDFSISEVVGLINRMVDDGIMTKGSDLWCFAMTLFEDAVKRELFLSLPDDASRLAWLNYKNNVGK
ncbi:hypothetical protein L1887_31139 [Cichorium endivia]|nr:hypothetical protein L1887_31139 [Cichorium endivia]